MFWWFEREGRYLRCETRSRPEGGYELHVINPDGAERVEQFDDPADLSRRQMAIEHDLLAEGWSGPHGWTI